MKAIRLNNFTGSIFSVVIVLFIIFSLESCARKFAFSTSQVVPAAEGSVKVKKGKNDNYEIELNVTRLAEPKRLDPPKSTYVVWMDKEYRPIKNFQWFSF